MCRLMVFRGGYQFLAEALEHYFYFVELTRFMELLQCRVLTTVSRLHNWIAATVNDEKIFPNKLSYAL